MTTIIPNPPKIEPDFTDFNENEGIAGCSMEVDPESVNTILLLSIDTVNSSCYASISVLITGSMRRTQMGYTEKLWTNRIAARSDLSSQLVHLTRSSEIDGKRVSPVNVLIQILLEGRISGSTTESGFICGDIPASCFQDVPVYSLSQNIRSEEQYRQEVEGAKVRYVGVGLMFPKPYVFEMGGRPVIYEDTEKAKAMLPEDEWWRIVKFNLSDNENIVDWTHEREWRVPGGFDFDLDQATVLLPSPYAYKLFLKGCKHDNLLGEIRGIIVLGGVFF